MKNFKIGKRMLAGVFGVAMSGFVPLSIVSAGEINTDGNDSTKIQYQKTAGYVINIPEDISVKDDETIADQTITSGESTNISGEKEVKVTVKSTFNGDSNNLQLDRTTETGGEKAVTTAVTLGGKDANNIAVKNGDKVATFRDQGVDALHYGGTLKFGNITGENTNNNPIAAGTYEQTLTFTLETVGRTEN